jgi:hypothetical protein
VLFESSLSLFHRFSDPVWCAATSLLQFKHFLWLLICRVRNLLILRYALLNIIKLVISLSWFMKWFGSTNLHRWFLKLIISLLLHLLTWSLVFLNIIPNSNFC